MPMYMLSALDANNKNKFVKVGRVEQFSMDIDSENSFELSGVLDFKTTEVLSKTPKIEKVIFNKPATIVFWNDGTKTVVKATKKDKFDAEKGLAFAICKKLMGSKDFHKVFEDNIWTK